MCVGISYYLAAKIVFYTVLFPLEQRESFMSFLTGWALPLLPAVILMSTAAFNEILERHFFLGPKPCLALLGVRWREKDLCSSTCLCSASLCNIATLCSMFATRKCSNDSAQGRCRHSLALMG